MARARLAGGNPSRLGNPAVRPLLAAPGSRLGAPVHAVSRVARRVRCAAGRGDDRAVSLRATRVPRGVHVLPDAGRAPRRRPPARAARARRLPARHAGRLARRVQRARWLDRSVPDGQCPALPRGSLRRRRRDDPHVRRRHATHAVSGARRAPAARARVSARRGGAHEVPRSLSRSLRGRPVEVRAVQGREQRHRAGRDRVLPAALLRPHRDARRLPAGGHRDRAARRRAGGDPSLLGRHRIALQAHARRQEPAAAAAAGALPRARCVQRDGEGVRAARVAGRDRRRAQRRRAHGAACVGAGRPPRGRSARRAQALSRAARQRA